MHGCSNISTHAPQQQHTNPLQTVCLQTGHIMNVHRNMGNMIILPRTTLSLILCNINNDDYAMMSATIKNLPAWGLECLICYEG